MFREMRRNIQQLSRKETINILNCGKTGVLGVLGDEGYPYTVPVNYVYEDGKIYFHCAKVGHKIDSINNCNKVSLCVIEKDDLVEEELTTYFRSVIVFGKAKILQDEEKRFYAAEKFGLKYNEDKAFVDEEIRSQWGALCIVEISIEHIAGKEAIELHKMRDGE